MKITAQRSNKAGKRVLTVEIDDNETLMAVRPDAHYKLGAQIGDIVVGSAIEEAEPVIWCSIEQSWI